MLMINDYIVEDNYKSYFCYIDGILLPFLEKDNIFFLLKNDSLVIIERNKIDVVSSYVLFNLHYTFDLDSVRNRLYINELHINIRLHMM